MNERSFQPTYEEEIDLIRIIEILKKHIRLILACVFLVTVLAGIWAFLMEPTYEVKAIISPVTGSQIPSVLQQLGVSGTPPPIVTDIVALLKSRLLRERVIKKYGVLPYFVENPVTKRKPEKEVMSDVLNGLENTLKVSYRQRDNVIELTFVHKDKEFACKFLSYVLSELNEYMVAEEKRVAETNKNYLLKEVNKTGDPYIKANIYSLIAQQIQRSMMAEAKENFAFKIIDPPNFPKKRVQQKKIVAISFVASLFLGVMLAFFSEYLEKRTGRGLETRMKLKASEKNG
ncbi:MAG: Wzz/FepE/Etk N-terminal domain-containing protein [Deltaproteobacteria bacterium]|nr:Wzz/FepE/Etk N-terminal domain-containing protein [Deltaproteobacteria bacterium]